MTPTEDSYEWVSLLRSGPNISLIAGATGLFYRHCCNSRLANQRVVQYIRMLCQIIDTPESVRKVIVFMHYIGIFNVLSCQCVTCNWVIIENAVIRAGRYMVACTYIYS